MNKIWKGRYLVAGLIVSNIKRVSPARAKRNMKRGTGAWCAVVVLAVVVSAFNGMARGKIR